MSHRPSWLARSDIALVVARLLQLPGRPGIELARLAKAGQLVPELDPEALELWRVADWHCDYLPSEHCGMVRLFEGHHVLTCRSVTGPEEMLSDANELHVVVTGREMGKPTLRLIPDRGQARYGDDPRGTRYDDDPHG